MQRTAAAAATTTTTKPQAATAAPSAVLSLRGGSTGVGLVGGEATLPLKVALMGGLTILHFACWLIPLHLKSFTESEWAMSIANSFSGGVFLSLAFGHLLPEAIHDFEGSEVVPCCVVLAGYFLIFAVEKILFSTDTLLEGGHGHSHSHSHSHSPAPASSSGSGGGGGGLGAVLLLTALGVHSLIETMALGVQSNAKSAWLLAASIGLHQPAESLALLVALVKTGLPRRQVMLLLTAFTMLGPLGLASGILASEVIGGRVEALLVALTAGTFIYVGATEVIGEEFEAPVESKWPKFGALSLGMAAIAAIMSVTGKLEAGM
jgi:zinc transporter 1/2/3